MSAPERRRITLGSETHRQFVGSLVATSPAGWVVTLEPPNRTLQQNALLHSLIADSVKGGLATDDGRRLTFDEAKVVWVTAWMGETSDMVIFDKRPVQLRRSTTTFDKAELSSLIEFITAECIKRGIPLPGDQTEGEGVIAR